VLLVVDEALSLAQAAGGDRSELMRDMTRIVVEGRALGIYVWLASQHARWDTLPRPIAVNLSTRVIFRCQDAAAAQLAGINGAERIPKERPGRFVALLGGEKVILQGYFIGDDELRTIAGQVGAPVPTQRAGLADDERRLVRLVVDQLEGRFAVGAIYDKAGPASAGGFSKRWLAETGQTWERKGWLIVDHSDPQHPRRVITPALRELAGIDA
jgi:DNA segregation ATPase FtsK/SpoIIIE-like protein